MAEAGGHLWISQADSDLYAAERMYDPTQPRTFCQAISKYQQAAEKSIKAIAAALCDRHIVFIPIGYHHETSRIASALRRPAKSNDVNDIQRHINHLLTPHIFRELKELDGLTPRKPVPGALHERNTEYPYELIAGHWTTPALAGSFTLHEVNRYSQLANQVVGGAKAIVSALRR
jgi:hypothetical protein